MPWISEGHSEPTMLNLTSPEALWVNLTSVGAALGIQVHWRPGIPLTLSLGYGYHPNETSYDAKLTFHQWLLQVVTSGQLLKLLPGNATSSKLENQKP